MCSYKKKYKIILCDIFATSVAYLQFRIVLMFSWSFDKLVSIHKARCDFFMR